MLDQIKAVQNRQVYDTQGQGPHAWHEQRLAEYEVVALDFCDLVGNAYANANNQVHKRRWFRNLFTEPIGSLKECNVPDEIDERYEPPGTQCTLIGADDPLESQSEGLSGSPIASSAAVLKVVTSTLAVVILTAFLIFRA